MKPYYWKQQLCGQIQYDRRLSWVHRFVLEKWLELLITFPFFEYLYVQAYIYINATYFLHLTTLIWGKEEDIDILYNF